MSGKRVVLICVTMALFLLCLLMPLVSLTPLKKDNNFREASYHWRKRTVMCKKILGADQDDSAKCALHSSDQRISEFGSGCYNEFVPEFMNIRTLCPLNCLNADEATVLNKKPSNNHKCSQFFNYGIVKLEDDTYVWRSGKCLNETITFDIRCGFPFHQRDFVDNPKDQYFNLI